MKSHSSEYLYLMAMMPIIAELNWRDLQQAQLGYDRQGSAFRRAALCRSFRDLPSVIEL